MSSAQLVAVGGAVIGGAVGFAAGGAGGAVIGAQIGLTAGSIAGGALFPPEALVTGGPRLGDAQVSTSEYGVPRPIGYGSMRMAGNLIWEGKRREKKKTKKISGGKGGGQKQKQTTFSYFQSFAMAFGEGPAQDVLRIWADSKIIFDKTVPPPVVPPPANLPFGKISVIKKRGVKINFYPGTTTQLPDSIIEAKEGAGNTPAFRDTVYIVFDDFALQEYGNRIPQITAEIAYLASDDRIVQNSAPLPDGTLGFSTASFAVDWERGFAYIVDLTGTAETQGLRKFRLSDMREVSQVRASDAVQDTILGIPGQPQELGGGFLIVTPDGDIIMNLAGGNSRPIAIFDGNTLREKGRFGFSDSSFNNNTFGFAAIARGVILTMFTQTGIASFLLTRSSLSHSLGILQISPPGDPEFTPALEYLWDSDTGSVLGIGLGVFTDAAIAGMTSGRTGQGHTEGFLIGNGGTFGTNLPISFYQIRLDAGIGFKIGLTGATPGPITQVAFTKLFMLTINDLFPGSTNFGGASSGTLVHDSTDNTLIFAEGSQETGELKWFKYSLGGDKIWETENVPNGQRLLGLHQEISQHSILEDGTFGYISPSNKGTLIDTVTGKFLFNNDPPPFPAMGDPSFFHQGYYNSRNDSYVAVTGSSTTPINRWFFNRKTRQPVLLSGIIENLVSRIGLTASDIVTTSLAGITTPGFLIARQTSARAALQALMSIYLFDGVESDHQIHFILRGNNPIKVIPTDDLLEFDNAGKLLESVRSQEVELPERVSLSYSVVDNDFLTGSANAKRIRFPVNSSFSHNQVSIEYPGALLPDFAKQTVESILYSAWIERTRHQFKLSWTHLALDPTDVIVLSFPDGRILQGRITTFDVGVNLEIDAGIIEEESGQFALSLVLADKGSGTPVQPIADSVFVFLRLLDIPLLRDIDEAAGRLSIPTYGLMGSMEAGQFISGTAYVSKDGINFEEAATFVNEMNWGTVTNVLGDPPENDQTDETNSLVIMNISGVENTSGVTQLDMLNGANAAAIITAGGNIELIQYRDVAENMDGTFTLTGLLRGRRGTEIFAKNHQTHELIILLDPEDMEIFARPLTDLGVGVAYKAVGDDQLFEAGQTTIIVNDGNALKPYAVSHITATLQGDNSIIFSWIRRTRVGGELHDNTGVVSLNEDDERYEVTIFDAPAGALLRTVPDILTPTYTYTSADQTADGLTPPLSSVTVKIYQISGQVGRGFSIETTVEVTTTT